MFLETPIARMFPQCFPVLPHFFFYTAETFRVSARHGSMGKRGNDNGNMFLESCFLASPGLYQFRASREFNPHYIKHNLVSILPFSSPEPPFLLVTWSAQIKRVALGTRMRFFRLRQYVCRNLRDMYKAKRKLHCFRIFF